MKKSTDIDELHPDVLRVRFEHGDMIWDLADGRSAAVPLIWYPSLMLATPEERADYHVIRYSAHWPQLDCDLGANAILLGHREAEYFAKRAWTRHEARMAAA